MSTFEKNIFTIEIPPVLNMDSIQHLSEQFEQIPESAQIVQLEGQQANLFCEGMDLKWVSEHSEESIKSSARLLLKILHDIQYGPWISVAIIDGDVKGGGVGLVSASDIVLATQKSSFQLTEGTLGLIPILILNSLRHRLKDQQIKKMVFMAQLVSSAEAQDMGLVDSVLSESSDAEIHPHIQSLLRCKPQSILSLKNELIPSNLDSERDDPVPTLIRMLNEESTKKNISAIAHFMEMTR